MMDLYPQPARVLSVRALHCGTHHHRITTAPWWKVRCSVLCVSLSADLLIFLTAMITLESLPPVMTRPDIDCPGDKIFYMCTVFSNSEMLELRWMVTFPGQDTFIMQLFTNDTERVNVLEMNVTARLLEYTTFNGFRTLVSTIELTVLQDVLVDGAVLECRSEDLDSENVTVSVNTSGNCQPYSYGGMHFT